MSDIYFIMDIIKDISDSIHFFAKEYFPDQMVLSAQIALKFLFLAIVFFGMDFLIRKVVGILLKIVSDRSKSLRVKAMIEAGVHNAVVHFVPWFLAHLFIKDIFWRHPKSYQLLDSIVSIFGAVVFIKLIDTLLRSVEKYFVLKNDQYRVTTFRAIYNVAKLLGYTILFLVVVSMLMGVTVSTVLGYIGAFTAVILLIFRDTILGVITGLHVSISKSLKVGDWIGIKKYDIEGTIQEINLLTTKIQNFDKTVSTIPTYDLLSTEIKNIQIMYEGNYRRIKRAVYFNIKSFRFIDDEFYEKLKSINLISDYLEKRYAQIKAEREKIPNGQRVINGKQLTNIGVFRIYTLNYLQNNPHISQKDILLVRQMEITPQGMPLEIYCFTNKAGMKDYEQIQADIFDHILTAATEFDLEVMQMTLK